MQKNFFSLITVLLLYVSSFMEINLAFAQVDSTLDEIRQLAKNGKHQAAQKKLDVYLGSHPNNLHGRFLQSVLYTETGQPNKALNTLKVLAKEYPKQLELHNNLAVLYAQREEYERARSSLETAILSHPSCAVAYENLSNVYAQLASLSYSRALQLDHSKLSPLAQLYLLRQINTSSSALAGAASSAAQVLSLTHPPKSQITSLTAAQEEIAENKTTLAKNDKPAKHHNSKPAAAKQELRNVLERWSRAWSNKDVAAYLASYSPNFKPDKGLSLAAWRKQRKARVAKPGEIKVRLSKLNIRIHDNKKATARFKQFYRSSSFKSTAQKTLRLHKQGDQWLIYQESVR